MSAWPGRRSSPSSRPLLTLPTPSVCRRPSAAGGCRGAGGYRAQVQLRPRRHQCRHCGHSGRAHRAHPAPAPKQALRRRGRQGRRGSTTSTRMTTQPLDRPAIPADAIKDRQYYVPGDNKNEQAFAQYWKKNQRRTVIMPNPPLQSHCLPVVGRKAHLLHSSTLYPVSLCGLSFSSATACANMCAAMQSDGPSSTLPMALRWRATTTSATVTPAQAGGTATTVSRMAVATFFERPAHDEPYPARALSRYAHHPLRPQHGQLFTRAGTPEVARHPRRWSFPATAGSPNFMNVRRPAAGRADCPRQRGRAMSRR